LSVRSLCFELYLQVREEGCRDRVKNNTGEDNNGRAHKSKVDPAWTAQSRDRDRRTAIIWDRGAWCAGAGRVEIADQGARFHDQRGRCEGGAGRAVGILLPRK